MPEKESSTAPPPSEVIFSSTAPTGPTLSTSSMAPKAPTESNAPTPSNTPTASKAPTAPTAATAPPTSLKGYHTCPPQTQQPKGNQVQPIPLQQHCYQQHQKRRKRDQILDMCAWACCWTGCCCKIFCCSIELIVFSCLDN